ncbi:MAG: hypothetical protein HYY16_06355 [Planctomycetes bacterium]|nr:hypothetical protein [Planctomycetota bacterium]
MEVNVAIGMDPWARACKRVPDGNLAVFGGQALSRHECRAVLTAAMALMLTAAIVGMMVVVGVAVLMFLTLKVRVRVSRARLGMHVYHGIDLGQGGFQSE